MAAFNRDRLMLMDRDVAAYAAHEQLAATNARPPEEQVAAAAIIFAGMCSRLGLDPQEMHKLGRKLLVRQNYKPKGNAQIEALTAYFETHKRGYL